MKPSDVILKLQEDNSRLAKEAVLKEAWDAGCYDFFTGAKLACDGLISFGVKQVPKKEHYNCNPHNHFNYFMELANKLQKRELTGHAARDAINDFMTNVADTDEWNLFFRQVLLKDLKSGISESTINKVLKKIGGDALNYMVEEFPYQRCCLTKDTKIDKFSWKDGVLCQKKADGQFVNVNYYDDGSVLLLNRSGQPLPLDEFAGLVSNIEMTFKKGTQSHGELLVFRDGKELPREKGNGILNSISNDGKFDAGDTPVYVVWDQIPLTSVTKKGVCTTPYKDRLASVVAQVGSAKPVSIHVVETKVVHSLKEAMEHYKEMLSYGFEGSIIKEPTAQWKDGTSKFCVKLKLEAVVDLEITGFRPGNGKNESTFGSIECKTADGLLEVGVSGFKDIKKDGIPTRAEIAAMMDELIGTVMSVKANGVMKPSKEGGLYSLFLPRFVEFRKDKSKADTLQQVIDQFDDALKNM